MQVEQRGQLVENLRRHVDRLAGLIGPRHVGRPVALSAAVTLIENEFSQSGYSVDRQAYLAGGHEVANLIATIPGTGRPDEIVILGAHYDTVESTPGADDNASAVAVLIEAARLLRDCRPRRTIRFVAFACEEPPHFYSDEMGSQVYARAVPKPRRPHCRNALPGNGRILFQRRTASDCPMRFPGSCGGHSPTAGIFWRRSEIYAQ